VVDACAYNQELEEACIHALVVRHSPIVDVASSQDVPACALPGTLDDRCTTPFAPSVERVPFTQVDMVLPNRNGTAWGDRR
jgi:hypothetical protein